MECKYEMKDGCLKIAVPRELDHHNARILQQETDLLVDAYHVRQIIFDFQGTNFMDSSGIGVLIGRSKNMGFYGGTVAASNMNARVKKLFLLSGLHKIIPVIGEENE